jgi:hypothetical protein
MALSTQNIVLAKRRALNNQAGVTPGAQAALKALFQYLAQHKGNPDLQVKEFALLDDTERVIADVACRLYALVFYKATATATFSKATDSATTASDAASELRFWQNAIGYQVVTWPDGLAFANGITMQGNTTANGGTSSGANAALGFAILGAA